MTLNCILKEKLKIIRKKYILKSKLEKIASWKKQEPIFILGTQKTGTTAIAALLGKCCNETVTLDLLKSIKDSTWPLRVSYHLEAFSDVVARYEQDFSNRIVKEPWLTFFYDDIVKIYPKATFVMVMRNPFDTMRSVLNRLEIPGDKPSIEYDAYPVLNDIKIWRLALDSSWSGRSSVDYITGMANRWDISAQVYLKNKDNIHLIKYEDFQKDKKSEIEKLATVLGYTHHENIEDFLDVQYQVKGNKNTDLKVFFGDENYTKIAALCGESAEKLGYAI